MSTKRHKNALNHGVYAGEIGEIAEECEQRQFHLQLNFIREAEEAIVHHVAAIQRVEDRLRAPLRLCLLQSKLIVSEIGQWPLDNFVDRFKNLTRFLTFMVDSALARAEKISQAKLAFLNATTPEEREKVLNAVDQLAESSTESSIFLQQIIRVASDLLMRFRKTLRE